MKEKVIKITKDKLREVIKECTKEVLARKTGEMPNDVIFQVGQMGMINLDESVLRPIPTEYAIQHLIASYRFAEYNKYLSDRNVGIVGRETLTSGLEVIVLFVKSEHALDEMEKVMAKMGWIRSSKINDLEGYPELVGAQFEKKKDFEATERVRQTKYIYHFCPNNKDILNKISKNGLCPKMGSWQLFGGKTPEQIRNIRRPVNDYLDYSKIYFFLNKPKEEFDTKNYFKNKNSQNLNEGYYLLKIDTQKIPSNTTFYYDPRQLDAVYTLSNIPPEAIVNLPQNA